MVTASPSRTRSAEADRDTVRAASNGVPLPTAHGPAPSLLYARTRTRYSWPGCRYPMPYLGSLSNLGSVTHPRPGCRLMIRPTRG